MKPNPQEKNKRATNHPPQHHWYEMNRKQRREMIRKIQSEELSLEVIHPDAVGIAIGNESHHASVPPSRDSLQTATTVVSEAGYDMSNWQTESLCVLVAALVRTIASAATRSSRKAGCPPIIPSASR